MFKINNKVPCSSVSTVDFDPAYTDVFRTSSGRLEKVTKSYDQTRRLHNVRQKTSDLRRLEDLLFTSSWRRPIYNVLKTSVLRRLEDVWFTMSRRRRIYGVLKTSYLQRLEDVWFMMSWRFLIYDVLKTSDLRRLKDIRFSTFWTRLIYDVLKTSDLRLLDDLCKTTSVEEATSVQRQNELFFLILHCLK